MRAAGWEDLAPARAAFRFDGRELPAVAGESIAAALAANGERRLRRTRDGKWRGVFCGMGVCQECLVTVDGVPSQRACMTRVRDGMTVETQDYAPPPRLGERADTAWPRETETPDVLVVGGGAAGLSAATAAARAGCSVVLLDERAEPGGQFYKQLSSSYRAGEPADRQMRDGAALVAAALAAGVGIVSGATVWGAFSPREIAAEVGGRTRLFAPRTLILATGAYERGVPLPGWTLPGVMTTGAAQTLLRAYRVLPGHRILVAGNGPLNLQVAAELSAAGAGVVAVAEAAVAPGLAQARTLLRMASIAPDLVRDGLRYRLALRRAGVPVLHGTTLARVEGKDEAASAVLTGPEGERRFEVDTVCMGYGFEPQNELARALGCAMEWNDRHMHLATRRDVDMETTVHGVWMAGDGGGLGGARAARAQGTIAGLAAARRLGRNAQSADHARAELARALAFQAALWDLYQPSLPPAEPPAGVTVCRCEEVRREELDTAIAMHGPAIGAVKRDTRAGMGRCQGRYCGPMLVRAMRDLPGAPLPDRAGFAARFPAKPVALAAIARREAE